MLFEAFDHQQWCGPDSPLAREIASILDPRADHPLSEDVLTSPNFEKAVAYHASRSDNSLTHRWEGLKALARFVLTGQEAEIDVAVSSFDQALKVLGIQGPTYSRPDGAWTALNKFGPNRQVGSPRPISALARSDWTPGSFIVHDFLAERCQGAGRPTAETTSVLAAGEMAGLNDFGAVLSLEVEALPGPSGLITPDFWAMGLVAFGTNPSGQREAVGQRNFLAVMHDAFHLTLVPSRGLRLRWRLRQRKGSFPRVMQGRSAEVAAACSARALMNRGRAEPGPLIDPDVAVTACLGEPIGGDIDKRPMAPVRESTLETKFGVALNAGLAAVLVCEGQVPPGGMFKRGAGEEERSVQIQPVRNFGDAYDGMLVSSAAVSAYQAAVIRRWHEQWYDQQSKREMPRESEST